ncbi:MAG: DUF1080 domain-containing protein [Balneolaceae bacterium]|nr:DUF1080 domain-containing protein [Balneolaceae bacterium]
MNIKILILFVTQILIHSTLWSQNNLSEWQPEHTETWDPVPEKVYQNQNNGIPSDALVLFDGKDMSQWESNEWQIQDDLLIAEPKTGGITTKKSFGDVQLHVEWRIPENVDGESQGRGNSGIFLQGLYEVQVLDTYDNPTYTNGQAGAIYKQYPPEVNASLPAGDWQKYDIYFEAPVFREDGKLLKPAYMTVLHNGVFIHNHVEVKGPTILTGLPSYEKHADKLPLYIQGSGHPLAFRNIWVREL